MKTVANISVKKVGSTQEQVDVTYKIEDVGKEADAKKLIKELDEKYAEEGAQTALDDWESENN